MGMYDLVFNPNPLGPAILNTLGLTPQATGRYRDCYVANGKIAVYTRNGGGNREDYATEIARMQQHPLYLSDADDEFDCTYATFFFSLPPDYKEVLDRLDIGMEFDGSRRWREAIEAMKPPVVSP